MQLFVDRLRLFVGGFELFVLHFILFDGRTKPGFDAQQLEDELLRDRLDVLRQCGFTVGSGGRRLLLENDQNESARRVVFAESRTHDHRDLLRLAVYCHGGRTRFDAAAAALNGLIQSRPQLDPKFRQNDVQQVIRRFAASDG